MNNTKNNAPLIVTLKEDGRKYKVLKEKDGYYYVLKIRQSSNEPPSTKWRKKGDFIVEDNLMKE